MVWIGGLDWWFGGFVVGWLGGLVFRGGFPLTLYNNEGFKSKLIQTTN